LFENTGLFDSQWGSAVDFELGMRAAMVSCCIYLPEELATWRVHPQQATGKTETPELRKLMLEMCHSSINKSRDMGLALPNLPFPELFDLYPRQSLELAVRGTRGIQWMSAILCQLIGGNSKALGCMLSATNRNKCCEASQFAVLRAILKKQVIPQLLWL